MKMCYHMPRSSDGLLTFVEAKEALKMSPVGTCIQSSLQRKLSCCWKLCVPKSWSQCLANSRHCGHKRLFRWDDLGQSLLMTSLSLCVMGSSNVWAEHEGLLVQSSMWKFEAHAVGMLAHSTHPIWYPSLVLHNNAPAHRSQVEQAEQVEVMHHPSYSHEQTSSDFHLFPNLKKSHPRKKFSTDDELKYACEDWLKV